MFGAPIRLPRGFGLGAFDPDVVVLHKKEKLHIFPAPFPPSSQQKKLQCSSLEGFPKSDLVQCET